MERSSKVSGPLLLVFSQDSMMFYVYDTHIGQTSLPLQKQLTGADVVAQQVKLLTSLPIFYVSTGLIASS